MSTFPSFFITDNLYFLAFYCGTDVVKMIVSLIFLMSQHLFEYKLVKSFNVGQIAGFSQMDIDMKHRPLLPGRHYFPIAMNVKEIFERWWSEKMVCNEKRSSRRI